MTGPTDKDLPPELADALLGLALAMCQTSGERAQDERLSRDERAEALCQGFRYLLVAHQHGIYARPDDEEVEADTDGGRP